MYDGIYRQHFKRPLDFILGVGALIILAPALLVIAALVRVKLGSPVLFRQKRPGLNEKIFTMYKFRTMTDARGRNGNFLQDEMRLTRFGRLLRSTSLDELPELFNILKGDMSVVGPRPLLVEYLPLYNDYQRRRHDVRPGLTGLAQINGRNAISWEDRFDIDVKYSQDICFFGDLGIILRTFVKVAGREGISSKSTVTMEAFKGERDMASVNN